MKFEYGIFTEFCCQHEIAGIQISVPFLIFGYQLMLIVTAYERFSLTP